MEKIRSSAIDDILMYMEEFPMEQDDDYKEEMLQKVANTVVQFQTVEECIEVGLSVRDIFWLIDYVKENDTEYGFLHLDDLKTMYNRCWYYVVKDLIQNEWDYLLEKLHSQVG